MNPRKRLSEELHHLGELCLKDQITFRDLISVLDLRGHSFLALFFAAIFFIPVPLPGLSIVVGLAIATIGVRMALGLPPWLPKKFLDRTIPKASLTQLIGWGERVMKKLEVIIQPRGRFLSEHPWFNRFNGAMIALGGILLALPLPPGTNLPPALGVALLSIGVLEQDGIFVACGHIALLAVTLAFVAGAILGVGGLRMLLS